MAQGLDCLMAVLARRPKLMARSCIQLKTYSLKLYYQGVLLHYKYK